MRDAAARRRHSPRLIFVRPRRGARQPTDGRGVVASRLRRRRAAPQRARAAGTPVALLNAALTTRGGVRAVPALRTLVPRPMSTTIYYYITLHYITTSHLPWCRGPCQRRPTSRPPPSPSRRRRTRPCRRTPSGRRPAAGRRARRRQQRRDDRNVVSNPPPTSFRGRTVRCKNRGARRRTRDGAFDERSLVQRHSATRVSRRDGSTPPRARVALLAT